MGCFMFNLGSSVSFSANKLLTGQGPWTLRLTSLRLVSDRFWYSKWAGPENLRVFTLIFLQGTKPPLKKQPPKRALKWVWVKLYQQGTAGLSPFFLFRGSVLGTYFLAHTQIKGRVFFFA